MKDATNVTFIQFYCRKTYCLNEAEINKKIYHLQYLLQRLGWLYSIIHCQNKSIYIIEKFRSKEIL